MTTKRTALEVYVNIIISKNDVTPWKDNPVAYKAYHVCHSTEPGPFSHNEKLFREVLPDEVSDTDRFEWALKNPERLKWLKGDKREAIDAAIREGKKK